MTTIVESALIHVINATAALRDPPNYDQNGKDSTHDVWISLSIIGGAGLLLACLYNQEKISSFARSCCVFSFRRSDQQIPPSSSSRNSFDV